MIVGIGTDIARIARFEQNTANLAKRCLSNNELAEVEGRKEKLVPALAKHFAAKEAVVKAFGTGFREGISFADIEILHNEFGKPFVKLNGEAAETLARLAGKNKINIFVSISDDGAYAQAFVIIEKYGCEK